MDSGSRPRSAAAVGLSMQAAKQIADSVFLQAEKKRVTALAKLPNKTAAIWLQSRPDRTRSLSLYVPV